MQIVSKKSQIVFLFSSVAMVIPKTANAYMNPPELDKDSSITSTSDSSLDAVESLKDIPTAIVEPKFLEWEEFERLSQIARSVEKTVEQTRENKLQQTTDKSQFSVVDASIEKPELAPSSSLKDKTSNSPSCIPNNIGQPEFANKTNLENQSKSVSSNSEQANFIEETKTLNTGDFQFCTPVNIGKPEFTRVADLQNNYNQAQYLISGEKSSIQNTSNTSSCTPLKVRQQESTNAAKLEKQTISQSCQPQQPAKTVSQPNQNSQPDTNYIIPPRIIPKNKINTFTTSIPLNGRTINHLSESEVIGSFNFGDNRNTTFDVNSFFPINSKVTESLTRDQIFTVEQTGNYFQLQTVGKTNEYTIKKIEPVTLLGTEIQLSLTGSCILPGTNPERQCTYTPGIVTDKNSLDPKTLFPTVFTITSNFGDELTPESAAAIKQPGFQMGANGQQVGLDLFFPNVGSSFGNSQSNKTLVSSQNNIENTPAGFYSTVRQILKVNDQEAVIGRTVRGFGFVLDDKNTLLNTALQLGASILPDADPEIKGGTKPPNRNINRNLFFAANNAWTPANSFTIYNAGFGRAETAKSTVTDVRQAPFATFESMWFGLSPVIKRSFSTDSRFQITGPRTVLSRDGKEGGSDTTNLSFLSVVNGEAFSPRNLQDAYSQIYLTLYNQDANNISSSILTEQTSYVPHLSFSGNITGAEDIFRYYAGMLAGDKINAYLGADYTKTTFSGWTFSLAGIAYTNPDYDYYSQVRASASKRINLNKNSNLILSTGLFYAFDRDTNIGGVVFNSPVNSVTLGARANIGNVSLGLVNSFGGILPNSVKNTLTADLAIKFSNNFILTAYYTPINQNVNSSPFGLGAQFKLGNNKNSPTLSLSWNNNESNLGLDPGGNKLSISNNTFSILLRGNI